MKKTEFLITLSAFMTILAAGFIIGLMATSKPPCPPCSHKEPADVKTLRRVMRSDSLPRIIMFEDGTTLIHEKWLKSKDTP
jgi:hypothetical protein